MLLAPFITERQRSPTTGAEGDWWLGERMVSIHLCYHDFHFIEYMKRMGIRNARNGDPCAMVSPRVNPNAFARAFCMIKKTPTAAAKEVRFPANEGSLQLNWKLMMRHAHIVKT